MDPNTLNIIKGAAGAAGGDPVYVEDVFNTTAFKANGSTGQDFVTGLDLRPEALGGKGGMVWHKDRDATYGHSIWDTERGEGSVLFSNTSDAPSNFPNSITFNSDGHSATGAQGNEGTDKTVAWSFRKAPGFFDVVTYTGASSNVDKTISHNLGCVPGMIIVKNITTNGWGWAVYHKHIDSNSPQGYRLLLDAPDGASSTSFTDEWANTAPTDEEFTVGNSGLTNQDGSSFNNEFVAYLFADGADADAQIFGDDGDESIIKCGSFTVPGTGLYDVNLGWEPQYVLMKRVSATGGITDDWYMHDTMRGFDNDVLYRLMPNTNAVETNHSGGTWAGTLMPYARGFKSTSSALHSGDYIYVAIRRGPMKTPEVGTEVFAVEYIPQPTSGTTKFTTNFPVDMSWANVPAQGTIGWTQDRLRGYPKYGLHATQGNYPIMRTSDNYGESTFQPNNSFFLDADNTSLTYGNGINNGANLSFAFGRAPGFFDVVNYNALNGTTQHVPHNLGVQPELMIFKSRGFNNNWWVYHTDLGVGAALRLDDCSQSAESAPLWLAGQAPGVLEFTLGSGGYANWYGNSSDPSCIAYLFASLPGVCKIGSYEGTGHNGGTTDLDFGFSPRFLLIRDADTNNMQWALFDSATGMSSSVGKFIRPNQSYDYTSGYTGALAIIDNITDGVRILDGNAGSELNQSGDTHIYMAIA